MRLLLAFMVSTSLMFGCGDSDAGAGGTGGDAGTGGVSGMGGGVGGAGGEVIERTFVVLSPIPPCMEGVDSDYRIEFLGNGITGFEATFDVCTSVSGTTDTTITCANDQTIAYQYAIETLSGEANDVVLRGNLQACGGLLTGSFGGPTTTETGEPLVDFFVTPDPPCEQGVASDYTVEVLVEGTFGAPLDATASFPACTGSIDSNVNTITCSNDASVLEYSIVVGQGGESQVTKSGQWDTCSALLVPDTR